MIQKMMIEIESAKPVSSYGDGHILVLDGIKNRYYVTTREAFLVEQDKKINKLNENFSNLKKDMESFASRVNNQNLTFERLTKEDVEKFKNDMMNQYNDFLKQYKETNEKMIELIKTVVIMEE